MTNGGAGTLTLGWRAAAALTAIGLTGCTSVTLVGADASTDGSVDATKSHDSGKVMHADASPPACKAPQTSCGDLCATLATDPGNCGMCGNACTGGTVCSQGKCALTCVGGSSLCGQACVDEQNDPTNCGGCGTTCNPVQVCSGGNCTGTCGGGQATCGADAGAPYCANEQTDNANCGACGVVCTAGEQCTSGKCALVCTALEQLCPGAPALRDAGADATAKDGGSSAAYCANEQTDNGNCGACHVACPAGEQCSQGKCALGCAAGEKLCPATSGARDGGADAGAKDGGGSAAYCANEQTDNANCGACHVACGAGEQCTGGKCSQSCSAAQPTPCPAVNPTYCANTTDDVANCGGCGLACGHGQTCSGSACGCPAPNANICGTGATAFCSSLATPTDCGACGHACTLEQDCSAAGPGGSTCLACTPVVDSVTTNPTAPAGYTFCGDGNGPCPIIHCGQVTYYFYADLNNDIAFYPVGYDPSNTVVRGPTTENGVRYVASVTVNADQTVTATGQGGAMLNLPWSFFQ